MLDLLPSVPGAVTAQKEMLAGPLPRVEIGPHCTTPYQCPFLGRCWPDPVPYGVETLYYGGRKKGELEAMGIRTLADIPGGFPLTGIQARQREAVLNGKVVVEGDLAGALAPLAPRPLAFLDFETVAPFIPRWDGCRPHQGVPVQFSCHILEADGSVRHHEWLASGPGDPRPECARRLAGLLGDVPVVVAWNAPFEKGCLNDLAQAVPGLAAPLEGIGVRLVDLLPVVRNHVYHPDFHGSFSLKKVLPALVPDLSHGELDIGEGELASAELYRLLFRSEEMEERDRERLRRDLLAYCALDTLALVRVLDVVEGLTGE